MKIDYTTVLSLGCLCCLVLTAPGTSVQAKSIEQLLQEETNSQNSAHQPHVIHKRNAWWSKKSSFPATELDHLPPHDFSASLLAAETPIMGPMHRRSGGAWWSKKSMGSANRPTGQWYEMAPMTDAISSAATQVLDNQLGPQNRQAIECYTNRCVTDLVVCQQRFRRTTTDTLVMDCQLRHRLCTSKCFQLNDPLLEQID